MQIQTQYQIHVIINREKKDRVFLVKSFPLLFSIKLSKHVPSEDI